ncbi:MAG: hypothetical protein NTW30_03795 [Candidatus Aenigmarchaeota archaeon]|nr:hypothetical protein [Candidatus Aenigmarchaeota archaeon]
MCKPWNKFTKDEKQAYVKKKMMCGFGLFLFGILWMYFTTGSDVASYIAGFVSTITVMGLLLILYGLVKKFSI